MSSPNNSRNLSVPGLSQTRSRSPGGGSFGTSPLVEASIARDLEAEQGQDLEAAITESDGSEDDSESDGSTIRQDARGASFTNSMTGSYRRPSCTPAGPRATFVPMLGSERNPTRYERREGRREERSLLRDNNVIPSKHPQSSETMASRLARYVSGSGIPGGDRKVVRDEEGAISTESTAALDSSETAPLLGDPDVPYGGHDNPENINKRWEEAVAAGKITTTWQREAKVLGRYSGPLVITFLLQHTLTIASIFTVGHLGKVELGAVSLGSMTANITGYAVYQGLATSLDTLCAQAYGSGRKTLVGLQCQRMVGLQAN